MPRISIIIPVYKVEKTLRRCVDSVLAQSFKDFEIILVNDGSPDECGEICDRYEKSHDNVSVIHKENGGLSDARNAGLSMAQGEYVMFLDSDDYLANDCLSLLQDKSADMVIGTITYTFADRKDRNQHPHKDEWIYPLDYPQKLPALLKENRLNYIHAKLYRKSIITANGLCFENDMLTSAEDTVFNFTFLKYCNSIFVSEKPSHFYVQHPGGLGKRFYTDRYARYVRLNDYIESTCKELGVLSDAMLHEINKRRVLSALWSINGIFRTESIDRKTMLECLEPICDDEHLREIIDSVEVDGKQTVKSLLRLGSGKYLKKRLTHRRRSRTVGFVARHIPRPVKKTLKSVVNLNSNQD